MERGRLGKSLVSLKREGVSVLLQSPLKFCQRFGACNLVTTMASKLGILVFAAQFLISRCAGLDNELVQRDTTNVTIAAPLVIPPSEYLWVYPWCHNCVPFTDLQF